MTRELVIDSFAGGGGASLGISQALGRCPDVAINHDAGAIEQHRANHPKSKHFTEDVWKLAPRTVTRGRPVGLLWASPDCKHFSRAKGGKPVNKNIRSLAWVVVRWAVESRPRLIMLENVREFEDWGPLLPLWRCSACDWRGTEGQTLLVLHKRRRCPRCDGRKLIVTEEMIPDPKRKGITFRRFIGRLRNLGYDVQWRVLNAADFGAPTHRRRLFLIARRDGAPIVWPEPTHCDPNKSGQPLLFGEPRKPWRTAAEIIDWSLPCPSIFERKRPLAEATMRRIAMGIKRYVLENPRPFIVHYYGVNKASNAWRGQPADEPLRTQTTENRFAVVTPYIVGVGGRAGQSPATAPDAPIGTVTAKNDRAVVTPFMVRLAHGQNGRWGRGDAPLENGIPTLTGSKEFAVVSPVLIGAGGPAYAGKPREADRPIGSMTAEPRSALVAAFLAKHYGGVIGCPVDTPMPTTTMRGTQNQIVAANLIHLNHGDKQWSGCDEPGRTLTTGKHAALVYSFLTKYFGTAIGQSLDEPLHTATAKARFGLVTVTIDGEPYVIVDIGMRMLTPRELARGQGFPDSYMLTGTNTDQVAKIGNSVPPVMAKVLVEANYAMEPAGV